MSCKSHNFIFKTDKCMKGSYDFQKKNWIFYFCMIYLKKNYGITESDLLRENFYKNFLKSGSLSPKYLPLSMGISE